MVVQSFDEHTALVIFHCCCFKEKNVSFTKSRENTERKTKQEKKYYCFIVSVCFLKYEVVNEQLSWQSLLKTNVRSYKNHSVHQLLLLLYCYLLSIAAGHNQTEEYMTLLKNTEFFV